MSETTSLPNRAKKGVGLSGVTAGNTALCTVGRSGNDLHYRGYDILDVADTCEFEEIAFLLVHGTLPTRAELAGYKAKLKALRGLPIAVKQALEALPAASHPMDVMRTGVSALGCVLPEKEDQNPPGARDIAVTRGVAPHPGSQHAEGFAQATLDLTRNAAFLRSLRLTSRGEDAKERTLNISGSLTNFARPIWHATVQGVLDMRLLEPSTGYPNSPTGMAQLDLTGGGYEGQFRVDGRVHVEGGSYIAPGVNARQVGLDAHVHADAERLLITSIVARLHQGGQIEGSVALDHWLPVLPGTPVLEASTTAAPVKRWRFGHKQPPLPSHPVSKPLQTAPVVVPVNGKVTAQLKNVALDTVLDIVSQRPFQRLGIDARLNGPATATWSNGDTRTVVVNTQLDMSPSAGTPAGEAPATGRIDGTYTQRDGAVDLRQLDVEFPGSTIGARGHLGRDRDAACAGRGVRCSKDRDPARRSQSGYRWRRVHASSASPNADGEGYAIRA